MKRGTPNLQLVFNKMIFERQIIGVLVGLIVSALFTIGGVTVQAIDRRIPVFQLNAMRLTGKYVFFNIFQFLKLFYVLVYT